MKLNAKLSLLAVTVMVLAAVALTGCGNKEEDTSKHGGVTIEAPWARVTTPKQMNGAAYMKISSDSADKLIKAEVDPSIADHAELHEASMAMDGHDKKMTMKEVPFISVPAELKPGGFHVMLIDLKKPIAAGDEVALTLTFEHAGQKQVTAIAKD